MLPIPVFNPGDTVAYPNGNGVINVGAADAGSKMLLYNESPFNINIDFLNGSQSILHAWEARYWTLDGDTRQVEWDINSTLNVTSSPISLVIGELYGPTDKLEGTYPMGLIRQTNVGNVGGVATTTTQQLINDGNALLQVIEATLSGHTSSDVIISNDGSYTLKGAGTLAAAAVLTHILGTLTVDGVLTAPAANVLGAIGILTHILGTLTVDQTSTFTGAATFTADPHLTSKRIADGSGNNLADWTVAGAYIKGNPAVSGSFHYQGDGVNTDFSISAISRFTGTGNVTVAHGLKVGGVGVVPDIIIPVQSVAGSQTMGYSALGATNVTITTGAGLAWVALAIKL